MSKMSKILIGAVALVLVFVVTFVSVLFWMKSNSGSTNQKKEVKKPKTTVHAIADPIIANLADNPNVNIRVVATLVTVTDKTFDAELTADDSLATNVIITVLRHKKVAEVSPTTAPDASMTIRPEIVQALNKAYDTDKFVTVNFKEFITQ